MGGVSARTATRLAWSLWAACVVLITLALLLDFATPESILHRSGERAGPVLAVLMGLLSLAYPTVGALIASRLPANPIGWIFCGAGLLYETQRFSIAYADYVLIERFWWPGGESVAWFSTWVGLAGPVLAGVFLMLLFPNGRLLSRRWRTVVWVAVFGAALAALGDAFTPGQLRTHSFVENPYGVVGLIGGRFSTYEVFAGSIVLGTALLLMSSLAALLSLILRLHRARGDERQQLKWFLYAAVPATMCLGVVLVDVILHHLNTNFYVFENSPNYTGIWSWEFLVYTSYVAVYAALAVPVFTYIAILRYHLYDIDVIINRTLVYGALSACVVLIYVFAVGGLGALFQARGTLGVSLLATGLVAVLFAPLRDRLQRAVNRLLYGERDDPYVVVSRLGERLEATLAPDAVLPTIIETVREALKLPYAAIALTENGAAPRVAASLGEPVEKPLRLTLTYQSEPVGELVLGPRARGETFSAADRRLLEGLARQAGVAAYAVRLTTDLQRSRERLVAAREEERRRLRRNLHDGLGAQLAGLSVQAGTLRRLIPHDPVAADEVVVELRDELRGAIADIRRLVYDLRPPALDDLGLVEALRRLAERYGSEGGNLHVLVEAPEELLHLPAAVEVAVYRIAQETLTNVVRHALAKSCVVRLVVEEDVILEIVDDGVGIPAERSAGVGLSSMRERAAELGGSCVVEPTPEGGTRVLVRLPLTEE
ncbi:MAG: sensor histidine kinase [Actinomycetota bacterium]|nr:sensor histidine kinase [Actinomycetota bacterium]